MSQDPKKPAPVVQVVKKPAGAPVRPVAPRPVSGPVPPRPVSAAPRPVAPRSVAPGGAPLPVPAAAAGAPSPAPRSSGPRGPGAGGPGRGPGGPRRGPPFGRPSTPRPPPTAAEIDALAKREKVPARIAKGELEGKMKARIWRKLHREEAARFDQAYALMEKHPELPLPEAFGVIQSGMSVEEFTQRRARAKKKEEVKVARTAVSAEPIDKLIGQYKDGKVELSIVLAERTLLDVITEVAPVSFVVEKTGRLEKLQVVTLSPRAVWEKWLPQLERDPKLSQKPPVVARQPAKRPVSDPRPFLEHVGKAVRLTLRNGLIFKFPLQAVGPFDLLVGPDADTVFFVPLHAIVEWAAS